MSKTVLVAAFALLACPVHGQRPQKFNGSNWSETVDGVLLFVQRAESKVRSPEFAWAVYAEEPDGQPRIGWLKVSTNASGAAISAMWADGKLTSNRLHVDVSGAWRVGRGVSGCLADIVAARKKHREDAGR